MYSISEYKISVLLLLSLAYSAISVFRRRHIVFLALSTCILSGSIRRTTTSVLYHGIKSLKKVQKMLMMKNMRFSHFCQKQRKIDGDSPSWIQFWTKFYTNNKAMWGLGFWVKSKVYKIVLFFKHHSSTFCDIKNHCGWYILEYGKNVKKNSISPRPPCVCRPWTHKPAESAKYETYTQFLSSPITLRNCWWGQSFFLKRKSAVVMHDCTSPSSSILHTMAKSYTYYLEKARNE